MGVWEFICSTTETVKRNAPDLTPAKDVCRISSGYGTAAVSKIDNAVRVGGLQKIQEYMPDEKGRAQISLFATKFAQNAARYAFKEAYKEAYKLVPGGQAMGKIVSKTIHDVKSENRDNQETETVKEAIGGSGKASSSRNVLDRVEMKSKGVQLGYEKGISADSTANQTPEDVLRVFMMKEFIGTRFLDDLIVPEKRHGKEAK